MEKKITIGNIKLDAGAPLGTGGARQMPETELEGVMVK
jgi:hypothetical protein